MDKIRIPTQFRSLEMSPNERCNLAGCENDRPSPLALAALSNLSPEMLTDHWDSQDAKLRKELGTLHGVDPGQVFLTSGALGAIRYSFEVFGRNAEHIGLLRPDWPGFTHFANKVSARQSQLEKLEFPFQFEVDDIARFVTDNGIDFLIISNPSAVTGRFWMAHEVKSLIGSCPNTMFVVDEADTIYPNLSSAGLVNEHRNVLFLESFSKFFGLSGLRVGYLVTPLDYANAFDQTIDTMELTSLALVAARAALADVEYQRTTQREVVANLGKISRAVAASPYLLAPGSQCFAAYLYAESPIEDPWLTLREHGVDLVPASHFLLERGGRLNLRNPHAIDAFVSTMGSLFPTPPASNDDSHSSI
ncbi:aminotransferase class I/II-fold pyridoxal phosphate-dependent enzyme [Streptomyces chartreusis]|uniref:aminotransferase class I/II-fold pyridoxal phosphate-dependent enzyme n=1 Tax=Streptomyces chartreusis TaxID=1969 RepID=UPI00382529FF